MNWKEYVDGVKRTELSMEQYEQAGDRLYAEARLTHAAYGMVTESAEFLDQLKRHCFYGKTLDVVNLEEEIGDLLWYVAVACDELEVDLESLMTQNLEKLKARYPEKFTQKDALNRNLDTERAVLESKSDSEG